MTYSYTQISQYLRCPRKLPLPVSGRLEGEGIQGILVLRPLLREGPGSLLPGEDSRRVLFKEWGAYHEASGVFQGRRLGADVRQGIQLLERLAQDNRIRIRQPQSESAEEARSVASERQRLRGLPRCHRDLDGTKALLEWKTTTARYPEEPEG